MNYSFAAAVAVIDVDGQEETYLPAVAHQQEGVVSYWTMNGAPRSTEEGAMEIANRLLDQAMKGALEKLKQSGFQCHSVEGRQ
jgi:hypothetical protein